MIDTLKIRVIGAGGAGVNAIKKLSAQEISNIEIIAVDTDAASLDKSGINEILPIGGEHTENMGTGGDTSVAKEAAIAHSAKLSKIAQDADVLIIVAGLGGGTGSVVAPILSKIADESSKKTFIITFSILPLGIEGADRNTLAGRALNYMRKRSNITISLPNDIILARTHAPMREAFEAANAHVAKTVEFLVKTLSKRGIVNIDLPTLKKIFPHRGENTFFAFGSGEGAECVANAVDSLQNCPLMSRFANLRAGNLLISLQCGESFEMNRMQMLLESAAQKFDVKGRVAFGAVVDDSFGGKIEVCAMGVVESAVTVDEVVGQDGTGRDAVKTDSNSRENFVESEAEDEASAPARAEVEVQPPVSSPSPEAPAPVVAEPDETPRKKRRGFFGFGRGKEEAAEETNGQILPETQVEFKFMEMSEQRGFFDDTPPNIRNGVDLDIPTFMRKRIKINL